MFDDNGTLFKIWADNQLNNARSLFYRSGTGVFMCMKAEPDAYSTERHLVHDVIHSMIFFGESELSRHFLVKRFDVLFGYPVSYGCSKGSL